MSSGADMVLAQRAMGSAQYDAPGEVATEPENPLRRLHLMMRGRYVAAAILALVLAAALATTGFCLGRRLYVSTGAIRVSPVRDVLDQGGGASTLPNYESFLDAQMTFLQSQRVLEKAMGSKAWQTLKRPMTDAAMQQFASSIGIHKRGEIIFVDVIDEDASAAMLGVKSLVTEYDELQKEEDRRVRESRMALLKDEKLKLDRQLLGKQTSIRELALKYNTSDIDQLYFAARTERNARYADLQEIELALAAAAAEPRAAPAAATTAPSALLAAAVRELTADEVAMRDRRTNVLVQRREQLEDDLRAKRRTLLAQHPQVLNAEKSLQEVNVEIRNCVNAFNEQWKRDASAAGGTPAPASADAETQRSTIARLKLRELKLQEMLKEVETELQGLGKNKIEMDLLKEQVRKIEAEQERFAKVIDQMELEARAPGVVTVLSYGDRPLQALRDTRITFGAAGGLAGLLMGVGVMLLWGLSDRRFRSSDDARQSISGSQLLGILPMLPEALDDSMQVSLASYGVHHIRIMLQVWDRSKRVQAFAVTSPVAGTGKTSLALALGASFAASGTRTLLVDCDVIGGGLTSRVNAFVKRRIGRILTEKGVVSAKQVERAQEASSRSGALLGETLVGLGFVKRGDLEAALQDQAEVGLGLVDALKGEDILNCVTATGVENLWVLPLGTTQGRHVPMLSPVAAKALIASARAHFDTVVVDTGPAPASLEAGALAAAVDGVVLTVSRGEHRPMADQCVAYLESVGARVVGFVFNRASSTDVERNAGGRSSGWSSRASKAVSRGRRSVPDPKRAGVLAEAVVARGGVMGATTDGSISTRD